MAHIHRAKNGLEEKLAARKQGHIRMARREGKRHEEELRVTRIKALLAFAACAMIFIALLMNGQVAVNAREWAANGLGRAGDWIMEGRPFAIQYEEIGEPAKFPFLIEAAIIVFRTVMSWIMIALGFCVSLLSYPVGWLVWLLLYALPLGGAVTPLFFLFDWYGKPQAEDYETAEDNIIRAGMEGEQKALDAVAAGLDNRCHVFTNLIVPYDGEQSETDLIAVTPSGVTVIEVKNHKGIICGDLADHDLIRRKILRSGASEDSTFYNPVKQVGTHVHRVAGYLRNIGVSTHVNCCVLFANEEAQFQLTDREGIMRGKCPVYHISGIRRLHAELHSSYTQLSEDQLKKAVAALDALIDRAAPLDDEDYDIY